MNDRGAVGAQAIWSVKTATRTQRDRERERDARVYACSVCTLIRTTHTNVSLSLSVCVCVCVFVRAEQVAVCWAWQMGHITDRAYQSRVEAAQKLIAENRIEYTHTHTERGRLPTVCVGVCVCSWGVLSCDPTDLLLPLYRQQ